VLTPEDWIELDEAFEANRDPLTGHAPEPDCEALFTQIVNVLPAPIGLGSVASPPDNPSPFFWRHNFTATSR